MPVRSSRPRKRRRDLDLPPPSSRRTPASYRFQVASSLVRNHRMSDARAARLVHRWGHLVDNRMREGKSPMSTAEHVERFERQKIAPLASRRDPARTKRPTFAKAREELIAYLRQEGWTVKTYGPSGPLKTPHATSPDGTFRVWFRPQAVYYTTGLEHDAGSSRSLWVDIRDLSPEAFVKQAARWA